MRERIGGEDVVRGQPAGVRDVGILQNGSIQQQLWRNRTRAERLRVRGEEGKTIQSRPTRHDRNEKRGGEKDAGGNRRVRVRRKLAGEADMRIVVKTSKAVEERQREDTAVIWTRQTAKEIKRLRGLY